MRVHSSFAIILLFCFGILAFGQNAGTTGFEFLRNQYSPRGAAMGGNLLAVKNDIHAHLYNPATMSANADKQWTINYTDHLLDFQTGYIAYAQPVTKWGTITGGLLYFNYGSFDETDIFGDKTGRTFGASEFAFALGLSNKLGSGFDYGLGFKFIYSSIDVYNAYGVALDGGLLYTVETLDDLQLGVSLLNLGTTLDNYTDYEESIPTMLQVGFSKRLAHLPLMITGSINDITGNAEDILDRLKRFSLGGEFEVSDIIKFRLGYENEINRSVKPLSRNVLNGVSLGLGIFWNRFRIDYAYSNYGDLGSQNRIGITGTF